MNRDLLISMAEINEKTTFLTKRILYKVATLEEELKRMSECPKEDKVMFNKNISLMEEELIVMDAELEKLQDELKSTGEFKP